MITTKEKGTSYYRLQNVSLCEREITTTTTKLF